MADWSFDALKEQVRKTNMDMQATRGKDFRAQETHIDQRAMAKLKRE